MRHPIGPPRPWHDPTRVASDCQSGVSMTVRLPAYPGQDPGACQAGKLHSQNVTITLAMNANKISTAAVNVASQWATESLHSHTVQCVDWQQDKHCSAENFHRGTPMAKLSDTHSGL